MTDRLAHRQTKGEGGRERCTHTHTPRDRNTDRQTDTHAHRDTHIDKHTEGHIYIYIKTEIQKDIYTTRQTYKHTYTTRQTTNTHTHTVNRHNLVEPSFRTEILRSLNSFNVWPGLIEGHCVCVWVGCRPVRGIFLWADQPIKKFILTGKPMAFLCIRTVTFGHGPRPFYSHHSY